MLVNDLMTAKEKLIRVSPMTTIREVLQLMKSHNVRSIIMDKTKPDGAYGLVTFKNILQSIVAEDGDIDLLNAYDIAATPAVSVSAKLNVKYAARMMVTNSIKRLLVIDDNEVCGILTMSDIITVLMEDIEQN